MDIEARKHPARDRWPLRMPCRLRMAVSCAIATNRERKATSKAIEPDSSNPSSVPPKQTASRSERHFCVKILGNLGTQAPLKNVLEPVSYIEPQRDFAWVCRIFFREAAVDGIGLPGMVAFMMLVPLFLDPASVGKPRSKLL